MKTQVSVTVENLILKMVKFKESILNLRFLVGSERREKGTLFQTEYRPIIVGQNFLICIREKVCRVGQKRHSE